MQNEKLIWSFYIFVIETIIFYLPLQKKKTNSNFKVHVFSFTNETRPDSVKVHTCQASRATINQRWHYSSMEGIDCKEN